MTTSPDYYHARARLAHTLTNIAEHLARHSIGRATKSIAEVTREYSNLLERLVVDAANGNLKPAAFERAMLAALRADALQVYSEGMREGGIKDPEAEFDEDDSAAISDFIDSQSAHVASFAKDAVDVHKLTGDERTAARDAMLRRVEQWVRALEMLGRMGYASAKENQPGTWRLGQTEEHCPTCTKLNGQRHRLKWFTSKGYLPQEPGSETLDCGGWNCLCGIFDDEGKRIL